MWHRKKIPLMPTANSNFLCEIGGFPVSSLKIEAGLEANPTILEFTATTPAL
jgi:hypothetical protein